MKDRFYHTMLKNMEIVQFDVYKYINISEKKNAHMYEIVNRRT